MNLAWTDLLLASVLLVSLLVGVMRGVVYEVLSLAGWFVAYLAAQWLTPWAQGVIAVGQPGSALHHGVSYAVVFLAALIAWGLLARLVRALIRATPLSVLDRMLGALFGGLRGVIILLLIAALVGVTPLEKSVAWQESQGAAWLNTALQALKSLWSGDVSQHRSA